MYRAIGNVLKQHYNGYEAWIISPNYDAAKFVGLRPSVRIPLYNGPIEARFIKFEMYQGSKRGDESLDRRAKQYGDKERTDRPDRNKRFVGTEDVEESTDDRTTAKPTKSWGKEDKGKFEKRRPEGERRFQKDGDKRGGFDKNKGRRFERPEGENPRFKKDRPNKDDQIQVWESQKEDKPKHTTKDTPEEKGPPTRRRRIK